MRANNVTDTAFIGLDVITAPTNIATAQRAMMTEKTKLNVLHILLLLNLYVKLLILCFS